MASAQVVAPHDGGVCGGAGWRGTAADHCSGCSGSNAFEDTAERGAARPHGWCPLLRRCATGGRLGRSAAFWRRRGDSLEQAQGPVRQLAVQLESISRLCNATCTVCAA